MTTGKDRNKDRFKNWQLWDVWKLPFRDHRPKRSRRTVLVLRICASISLLRPHRSWIPPQGTWTSRTAGVLYTAAYLQLIVVCACRKVTWGAVAEKLPEVLWQKSYLRCCGRKVTWGAVAEKVPEVLWQKRYLSCCGRKGTKTSSTRSRYEKWHRNK